MTTGTPTTSEQPITELKRLKPHSRWIWYLSPRLWLRKILSQKDTPASIALGAAIGTFIAFTPTVGIQMVMVLGLAWLLKPVLKFNRIAALIAVYISNPITTVPIFWFNYWIGTFFVEGHLTRGELAEVLQYEGFADWITTLWKLLIEIGWPLLIGSVLVGLICAVITYPVVLWLSRAIPARTRQH